MHFVKQMGQSRMARDFDRQVAEIQIRIAVFNRYSALGIHATCVCLAKVEVQASANLCNKANNEYLRRDDTNRPLTTLTCRFKRRDRVDCFCFWKILGASDADAGTIQQLLVTPLD